MHGDELENYYKEFDADILPAEFDGKGPKYDGKATAAKLFDWSSSLAVRQPDQEPLYIPNPQTVEPSLAVGKEVMNHFSTVSWITSI